jgi:large subunit ribosomal protein L5
MKPRLRERYHREIVPEMMKQFGLTNPYQVPRLVKVVVNVGLGEAVTDKNIVKSVLDELSQIAGQRPSVTKAKKAVAGFKIRKGSVVGCRVTLRKARMYEFLDRLINVAIPRIRDFRGLSAESFDERGNYSMGITEQGIFPEIDIDKIQLAHGMDIIIVIKAGSRDESFAFLQHLGMPFKK